MKKTFVCKSCNKEYQATWTKGTCVTCRTKTNRKTHREKYYKATNPQGHRANSVIQHEDGDWIRSSFHSYSIYGSHPIRNRAAIRSYNDLKRRYYRGEL